MCIISLTHTLSVLRAMLNFTGMAVETIDQPVDVSKPRQKYDSIDSKNMV